MPHRALQMSWLVWAFPCSVRLAITSATSETALYEKRAQAMAATLMRNAPPNVPPDDPGVLVSRASAWSIRSFTGTFTSWITDARADHMSVVPYPYCSIPLSRSSTGSAPGDGEPAISCPITLRLCQNTAPASSTLSNMSSRLNRSCPQLISIECR